jgi:hypothetical protein
VHEVRQIVARQIALNLDLEAALRALLRLIRVVGQE